MITSMFGNVWTTPGGIAKMPWFNENGEILWYKIKLANTKFVTRVRSRDDKMIQDSLKMPDEAVMLQVQKNHWVLALSKSIFGNGYVIIDPWTGKKTHTRIYKNDVTGFAIFKIK